MSQFVIKYFQFASPQNLVYYLYLLEEMIYNIIKIVSYVLTNYLSCHKG